MQGSVFREAEDEVHVLDCLTGGPLHQIIQNADNVQLVPMLPHIQETFVRVHYHLHVRGVPAPVVNGQSGN